MTLRLCIRRRDRGLFFMFRMKRAACRDKRLVMHYRGQFLAAMRNGTKA